MRCFCALVPPGRAGTPCPSLVPAQSGCWPISGEHPLAAHGGVVVGIVAKGATPGAVAGRVPNRARVGSRHGSCKDGTQGGRRCKPEGSGKQPGTLEDCHHTTFSGCCRPGNAGRACIDLLVESCKAGAASRRTCDGTSDHCLRQWLGRRSCAHGQPNPPRGRFCAKNGKSGGASLPGARRAGDQVAGAAPQGEN